MTSSLRGGAHPPRRKPPRVSSSAPAGACITPSSVTWLVTTILLMIPPGSGAGHPPYERHRGESTCRTHDYRTARAAPDPASARDRPGHVAGARVCLPASPEQPAGHREGVGALGRAEFGGRLFQFAADQCPLLLARRSSARPDATAL